LKIVNNVPGFPGFGLKVIEKMEGKQEEKSKAI
jgi:hypothetical protein